MSALKIPKAIDEAWQELETIFRFNSKLYQERGFSRRVGFGDRPALLIIDVANAWTQRSSPFECSGTEVMLAGINRLLEVFRRSPWPVIFTTTAYRVTELNGAGREASTDMGLWFKKLPCEYLKEGTFETAIDERVAPLDSEQVIVKKRASAFHGTNLSSFLTAARVDTVVVTGVTAAGCVRHTVEDAIAEGFRPVIPRECVGDRIVGAVAWNLFDIDAKFGDVEQLDHVIDELQTRLAAMG